MGLKRKPAYILADRRHFEAMEYANRREYTAKALIPLKTKCAKLAKELRAHLTRMRVKFEDHSDGICIFPDAPGWDLRASRVSFNPMFFSWPEVPNGRLRLSFFKSLNMESPRLYRVKKVSVLEPVYGFDTLALAKDLRDLRRGFVSWRKARNLDDENRMKSRRLADQLNINDLQENVIVSTSGTCTDPEKFEVKIIHIAVTPEEAEAIVAPLRVEE